jgi:transposase-like protein
MYEYDISKLIARRAGLASSHSMYKRKQYMNTSGRRSQTKRVRVQTNKNDIYATAAAPAASAASAAAFSAAALSTAAKGSTE